MPLRKYAPIPDFAQALTSLRQQGFTITEKNGAATVERDGCTADIAPVKQTDVKVAVTGRPGVVIGGQKAVLLDRGFQKFFKTQKLEAPATADKLKALHRFEEALAEAIGHDQLYNESLGTVSDSYLYDRVKGRQDQKLA